MKIKISAKKILCLMLCFVMILSVSPVVLAAEKLSCGHSNYKVTIQAREPGCEEYGYTEQRECNVCSFVQKAQYIPATGHDYKMVEGSQDSYGVTYKCDGCSGTYEKMHGNWSYTLLAKEPTCTEDGWTADKTCGNCGYHQVSEKLSATAHEYQVVSSEASSHVVKCSKCSYVSAEEGHELVFVYDGDFNCYSENATGKEVCSECGYVVQSDIAVKAGSHQNLHISLKTEYKLATCKDCGYAAISAEECVSCGDNLTEGEYSIKQATCDRPGYLMYQCSSCGNKNTVPVNATGHYLPDEYTVTRRPSCAQVGIKSKTCLRCDYTDEIEIPKTSHMFSPLSEAREATCTEDGITSETFCTLCSDYYAAVVIPAIGHNIIDYNGEDFCTNCYKYMIDNENGETIECKCICHNNDGLAKTVFKFLLFFYKLFNIKQSCECGTVHYVKTIV